MMRKLVLILCLLVAGPAYATNTRTFDFLTPPIAAGASVTVRAINRQWANPVSPTMTVAADVSSSFSVTTGVAYNSTTKEFTATVQNTSAGALRFAAIVTVTTDEVAADSTTRSGDCKVGWPQLTISQSRKSVLLIGQSNSYGEANIANVTNLTGMKQSYPAHNLARQIAHASSDPIPWQYYSNGALRWRDDDGTVNFGPEQSLGRSLPDYFDIIQFAVGNTSLYTVWKPDSIFPTSPAGGPNVFSQMKTFAQAAETAFSAPVCAVVWVQGEADATQTASANAYETNLTTLISSIRSTWPNVPFIFNQLSNQGSGMPSLSTVRTAQSNVDANVSGTTMLNVDDLPMLSAGNVHFSANGYVTLGQRFAAAVSDVCR